MTTQTTLDVLNRLLTLHSRSLPIYLANAQPWFPHPDSHAEAVLRHIAEDQQLMVDRIGTVLLEQGGSIMPSEFPMEFTDLHDLSIDYLIPQIVTRLQSEMDWMRKSRDQLKGSPAALAIVDEALGAAQGHLDNLNELISTHA